jgi:transcription initiation factor IIE alpha subunit
MTTEDDLLAEVWAALEKHIDAPPGEGEFTTSQFAERFGMERRQAENKLQSMTESGVLAFRKCGHINVYRLK